MNYGACEGSQHLFCRNTFRLERFQERHEIWLISPRRRMVRSKNLAVVQRFGLHFKIDLCIDVGGIERHMAQPRANGVDIHAGPEEMNGRGMPYGVGAHAFLMKRRYFVGCLKCITFHEAVNAEARHCASPCN